MSCGKYFQSNSVTNRVKERKDKVLYGKISLRLKKEFHERRNKKVIGGTLCCCKCCAFNLESFKDALHEHERPPLATTHITTVEKKLNAKSSFD